MPATVDQQAPLWPEQPADWRDGTPWHAPDLDRWVPSPPFAITTATVAAQAALWPEPFVPVRGADVWYSPARDPVWVPSPPFAITTATTPQQAATQPDQTRLAWTDGSPWCARTDESQDALLPPFNPAPFDWAEQPQAWNVSSWYPRTDDDVEALLPPPLLVQTDDAPALWLGTTWAFDGGADVLFTGPTNDQLSPLWADNQPLPAWPVWLATEDGSEAFAAILPAIGGLAPQGLAAGFVVTAQGTNPVAAAAASAPQPGVNASNPVAGGNAGAPVPGASASHATPKR